MNAPCSWPVVYPDCATAVDVSPELREQAEEMATTYLWNWTGRVYGTCPVTVRPCRERGYSPRSTWHGHTPPWTPVLWRGEWYNLTCGICDNGACGCGDSAATIRLPGPIASVEQVLIDGTPLPIDAYRVDNHSILVRTDGQAWPSYQDLDEPAMHEGTWEITYAKGTTVPVGGRIAAGELAEEFVKALCNDNSCRLPRRIQSITRQGVSMAVLDAFEDIEKGHTGIWMVDSWVASVTIPRNRSTVTSPDYRHSSPPARVRSTTWPV